MRRRDRQGEIVVAVVVVSALALALTFGIILNLSNQEKDSSSENTPNDVPINNASTNIANFLPTTTHETLTLEIPPLVQTSPEPSNTPARRATATRTLLPSETESESAAIDEEPTNTPTRRPSLTPRPSETQTREASSTVTREKSTPTNTPKATETNTPEPTATRTIRPTNTREPSATSTPIPSNTPTFTNTIRPTNTPTITLTNTSTTTLTITPFPSLTITPFSPEPSPTRCTPRNDWIPYVVKPGDTLFILASASGLRTETLRQGNCIAGDKILSGQTILLPPTSAILQTPTPNFTQSDRCDNSLVQITSPRAGDTLTTAFIVRGIANEQFFGFYRIKVKQTESSGSFQTVYENNQPLSTVGELGSVTIQPFFTAGNYLLLLEVYNQWGDVVDQCEIPVIFQ